MSVPAAVLKAYSDAFTPFIQDGRELQFRSSEAVDGAGFVEFARKIVGYNGFDPEVAAQVVVEYGNDAEYFIAREYSVCVYIKPAKGWTFTGRLPTGLADEVSLQPDGCFRLWWD